MKTEKFMVPWEDGEEEVTIRKMGWGEKQQFAEEVVETKIVGSRVEIIPKIFLAKKKALMLCLKTAPFPVTLKYIEKELDPDLGELIYDRIDALNGLDVSKKESEAESSESASSTELPVEKPAQPSQST